MLPEYQVTQVDRRGIRRVTTMRLSPADAEALTAAGHQLEPLEAAGKPAVETKVRRPANKAARPPARKEMRAS